MRTVAAILIIFLVRCVYLHPTSELKNISDVCDTLQLDLSFLNNSCIFGPKSMSMVLFNSANPEGKNIGVEESCSNIDPSKQIVFLVHGFISYANQTNMNDIARQLIKKGYTVFSLDWSEAACKDGIPILNLLEYPQAVKNTREIGKLMAEYVITLFEECKIPLENIMFIGHSLGAHVSGFAAKTIREKLQNDIKLIIGADPAVPQFGNNKCDNRLCKTDAAHVIIIHTSILGIPYPLGDVDLQFNGGKKQPDCGILDIDVPCSHSKSLVYLIYLVNNCVYPGRLLEPSSSIFGKIFDRLFIAEYSAPSYPDSNTTDCIVVTDKIFNIKPNDKLREGNYYVFVDKKPPYCTRNSFSCKSLTITAE